MIEELIEQLLWGLKLQRFAFYAHCGCKHNNRQVGIVVEHIHWAKRETETLGIAWAFIPQSLPFVKPTTIRQHLPIFPNIPSNWRPKLKIYMPWSPFWIKLHYSLSLVFIGPWPYPNVIRIFPTSKFPVIFHSLNNTARKSKVSSNSQSILLISSICKIKRQITSFQDK